jgi:hypothetical protein
LSLVEQEKEVDRRLRDLIQHVSESSRALRDTLRSADFIGNRHLQNVLTRQRPSVNQEIRDVVLGVQRAHPLDGSPADILAGKSFEPTVVTPAAKPSSPIPSQVGSAVAPDDGLQDRSLRRAQLSYSRSVRNLAVTSFMADAMSKVLRAGSGSNRTSAPLSKFEQRSLEQYLSMRSVRFGQER